MNMTIDEKIDEVKEIMEAFFDPLDRYRFDRRTKLWQHTFGQPSQRGIQYVAKN